MIITLDIFFTFQDQGYYYLQIGHYVMSPHVNDVLALGQKAPTEQLKGML